MKSLPQPATNLWGSSSTGIANPIGPFSNHL